MPIFVYDLFALSIVIAAVIAIVRYKRIYPGFRPFLFVCWASLVTETVCFFLINNGNFTMMPYGIYSLIESLLLTWFFREMGIFERRPFFFTLLMILYPLGWTIEAVFFENLNQNMTWFRLGHSFIVVVLTVILLSRELSTQRTHLLKSAVFLLCTAFLCYYSCSVIAGVFELYGGHGKFTKQLQLISIYLNFIVNLIYAVAILCMPRHLRYSLPY